MKGQRTKTLFPTFRRLLKTARMPEESPRGGYSASDSIGELVNVYRNGKKDVAFTSEQGGQ